jgi:hypothetical protein
MFEKPNWHIVPNEFVDTYLKDLSGAAATIVLVVMRKTFGFHKEFDYLSISQLMEYTGLSNRAVIYSTQTLITKDIIHIKYRCPKCETEYPTIKKQFICETCRTREQPNKLFSLSIDDKCKEVMQKVPKAMQNFPEVMNKSHRGSEIKSQGVMNKSHIQKETIQKETLTKALSLPVPGTSTVQAIPKKVLESESVDSEEDEDIDQRCFDIGKRLVEELYPFYFTNNQGGLMNSEKRRMLITIGFAWNIYDPDITKNVMAEIAGKLEKPSNLLAWASERLDKLMKGEEEYAGNNGHNGKR